MFHADAAEIAVRCDSCGTEQPVDHEPDALPDDWMGVVFSDGGCRELCDRCAAHLDVPADAGEGQYATVYVQDGAIVVVGLYDTLAELHGSVQRGRLARQMRHAIKPRDDHPHT